METNELFTSLAKLESTLQEVESAKNQVKQTVDAYVILQKQIKEYTQSLDSIRSSIQGIISDIRAKGSELGSEAAGILASFEASTRKLLISLNESTSNVLEELKTNLSIANEDFTNKSKDVATEFKNSTDEQLAKLQQSVLALQKCTTLLEALQASIRDVLSQIDLIRQEIAELKQSLESSQNAQDIILSEIKIDLNSISNSLSILNDYQNKAFSEIITQFTTTSAKMDELASRLAKGRRTNLLMSIIIIGLLITLALLVLMK